MSKQDRLAGPMMKRVKIGGHDYIVPEDAKIAPAYPSSGTKGEQEAWIRRELNEPLGGTW